MDYAGVLDAIAAQMPARPRRIGLFRRHWRMRPPAWLHLDPDMQDLFAAQDLLLTEGRPAWGAVVQANNLLFETGGERGAMNAPGDILWSDDPASRGNPVAMLHVAAAIFRFKEGPRWDAESQRFGELIADEIARKRGVPVPARLSPMYPTQLTSIFFDRRHLPGAKLSGGLLPLLVAPEATHAAMVVPRWWWPAAFVGAWGQTIA